MKSDRGIQRGTADLTRTADGDVLLGNGKHASSERVSEGHWEVCSVLLSALINRYFHSSHTQCPFNVRLIVCRIHRGAVQLAADTILERSTLPEGLVVRIEADNVIFEVAGVRTDRGAGRPRDSLEGRGDAEGRQQANDSVERRGRRAVMPVGHDTDGERSDI